MHMIDGFDLRGKDMPLNTPINAQNRVSSGLINLSPEFNRVSARLSYDRLSTRQSHELDHNLYKIEKKIKLKKEQTKQKKSKKDSRTKQTSSS